MTLANEKQEMILDNDKIYWTEYIQGTFKDNKQAG